MSTSPAMRDADRGGVPHTFSSIASSIALVTRYLLTLPCQIISVLRMNSGLRSTEVESRRGDLLPYKPIETDAAAPKARQPRLAQEVKFVPLQQGVPQADLRLQSLLSSSTCATIRHLRYDIKYEIIYDIISDIVHDHL